MYLCVFMCGLVCVHACVCICVLFPRMFLCVYLTDVWTPAYNIMLLYFHKRFACVSHYRAYSDHVVLVSDHTSSVTMVTGVFIFVLSALLLLLCYYAAHIAQQSKTARTTSRRASEPDRPRPYVQCVLGEHVTSVPNRCRPHLHLLSPVPETRSRRSRVVQAQPPLSLAMAFPSRRHRMWAVGIALPR